MRDFSLRAYEMLLDRLTALGQNFVTFEQYCEKNVPEQYVIMRHDVDKSPEAALRIAEIENQRRIKASYYFRAEGFERSTAAVRRIVSLGHEIGYHYEDLSAAKGNLQYAIILFNNNLKMLREFYPVRTICMHGSPLSRYDNRSIWENYDYRKFGVIGEPYLDVDFKRVIYLTDTGRRWDGADYNIRDKVASPFTHNYRSTFEIVEGFGNGRLPHRAMITTHPHRWNQKILPWFKELVWQNTKNIGKRYFLVRRK